MLFYGSNDAAKAKLKRHYIESTN